MKLLEYYKAGKKYLDLKDNLHHHRKLRDFFNERLIGDGDSVYAEKVSHHNTKIKTIEEELLK